MATVNPVDARVTLTKGQFLKIYRWQKQLPLSELAVMTKLRIGELTMLENDEPSPSGKAPDLDRLTALLGCEDGLWERVGKEPGFPGTDAAADTKAASRSVITFAAHINRIAAMPDAMRQRQMLVIQRELGYIDA